MNEEANISGKFGTHPTATGAQTVSVMSHGFQAFEDTTFGTFKNYDGVSIDHRWAGGKLAAGTICTWGEEISEFTITIGGWGQALKSRP